MKDLSLVLEGLSLVYTQSIFTLGPAVRNRDNN